MCFDIGSQHLGCWGQNTPRIQNNEVYGTLHLQAVVRLLVSKYVILCDVCSMTVTLFFFFHGSNHGGSFISLPEEIW